MSATTVMAWSFAAILLAIAVGLWAAASRELFRAIRELLR